MRAGLGFVAASPAIAAVNFLTATADATSKSTYAFTGISVSPVASDAYLVFAAMHENSTGRSFTGGTINGNTAASLSVVTTGTIRVGLYGLAIPSATSADIAFTLNAAAARGAFGAWVLTGMPSPTPAGQNVNNITSGTSVGTTLAVNAGGILIAAAATSLGGANTMTWTGLTESFDINIGSVASFSGGFLLPTASDAAHSVSASFSGSGGGASIAAVSF